MNAIAYTKARKKQSLVSTPSRDVEQALLNLESVCFTIRESQFAQDREDTDTLYWQRRFKNIVTPVSLALIECKGPRHFHQHYKHREDDNSVLTPVLDDPLKTLANVCKQALAQCQIDLVGVSDKTISTSRKQLEAALQEFLKHCKI